MLKSLSKIFSQGFLFKDMNGDGVTDYLDTRIIISDDAPKEDIVGASNIAARLGFETMGLDLPLVLKDSEFSSLGEISTPILLGRENRFIGEMVEEGKVELEECAPAQGLIELYVSPPGDHSAIIISGGDDMGTESAANYMAARIPYIWELNGIRLEDVERERVLTSCPSRESLRISATPSG